MRKLSKVLAASIALISLSAAPLADISIYPNALPVHAQTASAFQQANTTTQPLANSDQQQLTEFADPNQQITTTSEQETSIPQQEGQNVISTSEQEPTSIEQVTETDEQDSTGSEQITSTDVEQPADPSTDETPEGQIAVPTKETIAANQVVLIGNDRYQFAKNSDIFFINGKRFASDEKAVVIKGTTYVQFKSIATAYGFKVGYNKETKQSTATLGDVTIAFKINDNLISVNGKTQKMNENSILSSNGNLMVPIRAWANATNSSLEVQKTYIRLVWNTLPKATFTVNEQDIIARETKVSVTDKASTSYGAAIVEESWEGLEEIYNELGQYTITRKVKDSRGYWSNPYSVTIDVLKPNEPPVANFHTSKSTYKLGEPVYYTNTSTDDGRIISSVWSGNDPAFFKPGTHKITLQVHDDRRATSIIEKTITVTDEVMYTQEQFYLNFSAPGDKIPVEPGRSLQLPTVGYEIVSQDVTTVRMNSPEQISGPALDYSDVLSGHIRFNIHKQNISDQPLELHLIATNEGETTATLNKLTESFAGPATYVSQSGKTATIRYLEQLLNPPAPEQFMLEPGESKEILIGLPQISTGKIFSLFSDFYSEDPIRFTLVVTERKADPFAALETLSQSEHDGRHTRGTFTNGTRDIVVNHIFGMNGGEKLIFGDRTYDQVTTGIDAVNGKEVVNSGNFDVVYNMVLNVAPHTAVMMNPRGGHYAGAFTVNDEVVAASNNSILKGQNEASLLYRSGNFHERISISFIVAPGSNLPIHLMFLPVPSLTGDGSSNEDDVEEETEQVLED